MEIINRIRKYLQTGRSWYTRETATIKKITVHHSASTFNGTDDEILMHHYKGHVANDWPGLSYHFVISPKGVIYQINELTSVTWHDTQNWDSIGICVDGYFHPTQNQKPNDAQLKALKSLLDDLCTNHPEFPADFDDVVGHRERSATACPGDLLFPYVTEYRTKLGKVSWGGGSTTTTVDTSKDLERKASRWVEIAEFFDIDVFTSPSWIKDKWTDLKDKYEKFKKRIDNILDEKIKGLDGQEKSVSYYVNETFNKTDQVERLKVQLEVAQKNADSLAVGKDEAIKTLNDNVKVLNEQLTAKGKELGTANTRITELTNEIATLKAEQDLAIPDTKPLTIKDIITIILKLGKK